MVTGSRQTFLAENYNKRSTQLDNQPISKVKHAKSLGLTTEERLSWSSHISDLGKKVSSAIGALRCIRPLIPKSTAVHIYDALIQPHFDYCAPVWDGLSCYLSEKPQKVQDRAARVILQENCAGKLKPPSSNIEVGSAIFKKKKAKSYCDASP